MSKSLGERADTITEADLLKEIEKLAVERQSNLINTVALMSASQECDEGICQFAARLRGLAAVCTLSTIEAAELISFREFVCKKPCFGNIGVLNFFSH